MSDSYMQIKAPIVMGELAQIRKDCIENGIPIIREDTAGFLAFLLSVKKPERILEVGTAAGFSTGFMMSYLGEGGAVTTIEKSEEYAIKARQNFERLGILNAVNLLTGEAIDILPLLKDLEYDFIFLDAAKGQYIKFLPDCLRLLKPSGILVADDVFQRGLVAKDRFDIPRRRRTIHARIREFLSEISNNEDLTTAIIPIGDGLSVSYKNK